MLCDPPQGATRSLQWSETGTEDPKSPWRCRGSVCSSSALLGYLEIIRSMEHDFIYLFNNPHKHSRMTEQTVYENKWINTEKYGYLDGRKTESFILLHMRLYCLCRK